MIIEKQLLPEVLLLKPKVFADERGFFVETARESVLKEVGIANLKQQNQSRSQYGVLRGLHYQLENPQEKNEDSVGSAQQLTTTTFRFLYFTNRNSALRKSYDVVVWAIGRVGHNVWILLPTSTWPTLPDPPKVENLIVILPVVWVW